ncbi:MAG: phytanoyl-CoA dioxygenase [Rhodospirillaceae bacterium]|mgnify:CR=1 FL=1|nr:phytanoyl-CoA dioxygenase [Rhodospirillaceae bacterium]|tara:strand:- start:7231 stop:8178 length:948 start_codon:yes stop_codon:yes gene_type:complete
MVTRNAHAPDTPIDTLYGFLMDQGYLIIEHLADELVAQTRAELDADIEAAPFGHDEFLGPRTKRLGRVLARSHAARDLAIHPTIMALCDATLLPSACNYQLNFSGVMHLEPGAQAQQLHRDGSIYPIAHPSPPLIMPAMWALSDFTAENGGTLLAPGSHVWEHERMPFVDEVVNAVMPAGSVLLYLGSTWHGGGANESNTVRTGLALQYSLSWLRQEENQYLANPPEVAREYPERLRRLIGYDFGGPYLGFHNGDDPHRVFESDYDGHPARSRTELDDRSAGIDLLRLGDIKAVPTPKRRGEQVYSMARQPKIEA